MLDTKLVAQVRASVTSKVVVTPVLICETVEHEEYFEIRIPKRVDGKYLEPTAEKVNTKGQTVPPGYAFAKIQFPQISVVAHGEEIGPDGTTVPYEMEFPSKPSNNFNLFYKIRQ